MSKKFSGFVALLAIIGLTLFLMSCGSSSSRPAGILYYLSQGEQQVGSYAINLDNGALSLINKTAKADVTPSSILLDPSGKVAYVLNTGANNITSYTVNSDGSLSTPTPTSIPIPGSIAMARDAAGTFLAVISQGIVAQDACAQTPGPGCANLPAITVFLTASGSATLTQAGAPVILNFIPTSITASITGAFDDPNGVSVNGTLVHITGNKDLTPNNNDNTISEFVVQASGVVTGPLKTPNGFPYNTASAPSSVATVHTTPTGGAGGLFVYVTNTTTNNVNVFQVCTAVDGTNCVDAAHDVQNAKMIPVGDPVSVGLDPVAMTVDPTNNFLYVVNQTSATVSAFRINATTGALSGLSPATVSTGASPVAISMHSTGKFLYVSNNASSNISGFNADTTSGALSNATNITSSAQPAGLVAK